MLSPSMNTSTFGIWGFPGHKITKGCPKDSPPVTNSWSTRRWAGYYEILLVREILLVGQYSNQLAYPVKDLNIRKASQGSRDLSHRSPTGIQDLSRHARTDPKDTAYPNTGNICAPTPSQAVYCSIRAGSISPSTSSLVQAWSVTPAAMAGVVCIPFLALVSVPCERQKL